MSSTRVGRVLRERRNALKLSLLQLTVQLRGYPTASVISRIERGLHRPTIQTIEHMAPALELPMDVLANAFGLLTPQQQEEALGRLEAIVHERVVLVPVYAESGEEIEQRRVNTTEGGSVFVVRLRTGTYRGDAVVAERAPRDERLVVLQTSDGLSVWMRTGDGYTNERNETPRGRWSVRGAIVRIDQEER